MTKKILLTQKQTCAFGDGDGSYCWNHPRNKKFPYLKLEWGHKIPIVHGSISQKESNLILLCARCNNHIQSSKTIAELILELEHKLRSLKKLNRKG
jgi:5-methylcytosine-specific restriction endonuclease McrA